MLMSGDWVLPVSFGADIPYKPPFLAWMIAMLSLPFGSVSEAHCAPPEHTWPVWPLVPLWLHL